MSLATFNNSSAECVAALLQVQIGKWQGIQQFIVSKSINVHILGRQKIQSFSITKSKRPIYAAMFPKFRGRFRPGSTEKETLVDKSTLNEADPLIRKGDSTVTVEARRA